MAKIDRKLEIIRVIISDKMSEICGKEMEAEKNKQPELAACYKAYREGAGYVKNLLRLLEDTE